MEPQPLLVAVGSGGAGCCGQGLCSLADDGEKPLMKVGHNRQGGVWTRLGVI